MARLSHRTDIRPVQQPRTKSYIHASSHYASLSRLGSGVRTLEVQEAEKREITGARKNRTKRTTVGYLLSRCSSFFSSTKGTKLGVYRMALEEKGEPRESASGWRTRGAGGGGRKGRTLYFIRRGGAAVVARTTEKKARRDPYPAGASIGEPSLFR